MMGCVITKTYASKNSMMFPSYEFEPTSNGKKEMKKICVIENQSNIITESQVTIQYAVKSLIGEGAFSNVFRVESTKTKLPFAIKAMEMRSLQGKELFESELSVLKKINTEPHENIINFIDVIYSKHYGYIVMELATGGDLLERIQSRGFLEENEAHRITKMLISGVCHLHSKGITHRDLKPENILFYTPGENSRIVITDFGFSVVGGFDNQLQTFCGTPQYLSPEQIKQKTYNNKVDMWSLGVVVYVMLCGRLPFNSENIVQLHEKITSSIQSYKRAIWNNVSSNAKMFINKLLEKNPEIRLNSEEASREPWIGNMCLFQSKALHPTTNIPDSKKPSSLRGNKNCNKNKTFYNLSETLLSKNVEVNEKNEDFNKINVEVNDQNTPNLKNRNQNLSLYIQPKTNDNQTSNWIKEKQSYDEVKPSFRYNRPTSVENNSFREKTRQTKNNCELLLDRQLVIPKSDRKIHIDELFGTDTSTSQSTYDDKSQVFIRRESYINNKLNDLNRELQNVSKFRDLKSNKNQNDLNISRLSHQQFKEQLQSSKPTQPNESVRNFVHLDRLFAASQTVVSHPSILIQGGKKCNGVKNFRSVDRNKVNSWLNAQHIKKPIKS
ncbi:serine/threonine-protein kinase H1 homolog [Hydra vulgaris]|uniref:serine/threonine-protein kinase H1 homolog n=1 Tax=Hydra vulgaris TaxID=6087 RepID=UPI001F5F0F0D|nr:serine/threonine-protein kinase H1 homolog [Hydra vulgaris]